MQLRSNNDGDLITFHYYDASIDSVLDITESYNFVINDIFGDIFNPFELNITTTVDLSIELIEGYNWISFNLDLEDSSPSAVLASLGDDAEFITSQQSGSSINYGEYGWYGGLSEMKPTEMYKLKMTNPATLIITGKPVDLESNPISLISGWNWISFLPQYTGSVQASLENLGDLGEFITSQASGASTNYFGDYGWYGGLSDLEPGSGYLLKMFSEAELIYPEFQGIARKNTNLEVQLLPELISDWNFNYGDFEYLGNVTISIGDFADSDGDMVSAFVNNECRGIAKRTYFPLNDSYLYTLQVYSNADDIDAEMMTFKYYNRDDNRVISFAETLQFSNNMIAGDAYNTLELNNVINPIVEEYSLSDAYPNPFNPSTELSFTIKESGNINLSIYDMTGRLVNTLVNGDIKTGYHRVTWNGLDTNGQAVSSGMYIYSLNGDGVSITKKMMLMK